MARKLRYNDEEGGMAKAQLQKIEMYASKLNQMIHPDDELEGWVQAKLAVVAAYMGDVKHYLDYELKQSFGDGGVPGMKKRYWEVEFTWAGAIDEGRKVNVMADTIGEAEKKVKEKFGPYYRGLRIVEIEEDSEVSWDEYSEKVKKDFESGKLKMPPRVSNSGGKPKMADGGMSDDVQRMYTRAKKAYDRLFKTGQEHMYPNLTGDWEEDKDFWYEEYMEQMERSREGDEYGFQGYREYKDGGELENILAKGGNIDEVNTEVLSIKKNILGTAEITLKIANMRKPQEFSVYPIKEEDAGKPITIQSDSRIGLLQLSTGRGLMSQSHPNGAYFVHLQMDKKIPFKISAEDTDKIRKFIISTAGANVGNSVVKSDNLGAAMMADGGELNLEKVYVEITKPTEIKSKSIVKKVQEFADMGYKSGQILLKTAFVGTDKLSKELSDSFQKLKNNIFLFQRINKRLEDQGIAVKKMYKGGRMSDLYVKYEGSTFQDDMKEAEEYVGKEMWDGFTRDEKIEATKYLKAQGLVGYSGEMEDLETVASMQYKKGGKS